MPMRPRSPAGNPERIRLPGIAGVIGFVDGRFGSAVDQRPLVPPPLIGRGQQPVRIGGIDGDIGDARILADGQNVLPGFSAVGGFENSAIAARRPQRTLRRHVDHVRIARIDHDAGDVLGILQTQIAPASPAVVRTIDPIAPVHAALAVVLAGSDPHGRRIFRIERDRSYGIGAFVIEHRASR